MRRRDGLLVLDLEDVLAVSAAATQETPTVRDRGLLLSAIDRPFAAMFGVQAYPTLLEKTGALLHALARNHALVDGNKRTALAVSMVFTRVNGTVLLPSDQSEAVDLTVAVAQDEIDVPQVASILAGWER